MRKLKFILLTTLILLSGATLSGLAAWKVVVPANREPVSAGVLPVPSVLGQTADEVLFYPWSLYDMQTLNPITQEEIEQYESGDAFPYVAAMEALGARFDMDALVRGQVTNCQEHTVSKIRTSYLKDFPAVLPEGDVPVLLSYAASASNPMSVSWLMRPREEAELSAAQQQAALNKVKGDLTEFLWFLRSPDQSLDNDLTAFLGSFDKSFATIGDDVFYYWLQSWISLMYLQYGNSGAKSTDLPKPENGYVEEDSQHEREEPPLALENLLAQGQGNYAEVQFVSTPRQIVLLFNMDGGLVLGVYYDIQLGRYSGLGLSG